MSGARTRKNERLLRHPVPAADAAVLKALQVIPGVGPSIARDLYALGVRRVDGLCGQDAQQLYDRSNRIAGQVQDRCLLYVYRCAVYFAETKRPDAEKLKWWNWMDAPVRTARAGRKP
ncbi:MAG: helix-hairpin-helix domain-containing protein [Stenotrophobium sp.]